MVILRCLILVFTLCMISTANASSETNSLNSTNIGLGPSIDADVVSETGGALYAKIRWIGDDDVNTFLDDKDTGGGKGFGAGVDITSGSKDGSGSTGNAKNPVEHEYLCGKYKSCPPDTTYGVGASCQTGTDLTYARCICKNEFRYDEDNCNGDFELGGDPTCTQGGEKIKYKECNCKYTPVSPCLADETPIYKCNGMVLAECKCNRSAASAPSCSCGGGGCANHAACKESVCVSYSACAECPPPCSGCECDDSCNTGGGGSGGGGGGGGGTPPCDAECSDEGYSENECSGYEVADTKVVVGMYESDDPKFAGCSKTCYKCDTSKPKECPAGYNTSTKKSDCVGKRLHCDGKSGTQDCCTCVDKTCSSGYLPEKPVCDRPGYAIVSDPQYVECWKCEDQCIKCGCPTDYGKCDDSTCSKYKYKGTPTNCNSSCNYYCGTNKGDVTDVCSCGEPRPDDCPAGTTWRCKSKNCDVAC